MTDPLNIAIPLGGIDTTIPVLPENLYDLQISDAIVEPNKDKTGNNLVITLKTTTQVESIPGETGATRTVNPGFPLKAYFALQAKPDSTDPEAFKRNLCDLVDAAFGSTADNRPELNRELLGRMVGQIVRAKVVIDDYQGRKNNKIGRLQKAA